MLYRKVILAAMLVALFSSCTKVKKSEREINYEELASKGLVIYEENFPDANFSKFLLAQGYGADLVITPEEMATITSLNVDHQNICSLKGIENFPQLTSLSMSDNPIDELQLAVLPNLQQLLCHDCALKKLDIQLCKQLEEVDCSGNQLDSLNANGMPALTSVLANGNRLKGVRFSDCPKLRQVGLSTNRLITADLSRCPSLHDIDISENPMSIEVTDIDTFVRTLPVAANDDNDETKATIVGLDVNRISAAQQKLLEQKGWTLASLLTE